jgi:hypothetical protein
MDDGRECIPYEQILAEARKADREARSQGWMADFDGPAKRIILERQ